MKFNRSALVTATLAVLSVIPANAANTFYNPGDLVMFFQEKGGTNTVYVSLGAATGYRGASSGADASAALNIINLDTTLTTAFGAGWQSNTNLYAGLAGVRSATAGSTVTDGDPKRTLYVSQSRPALGDLSVQGSPSWTVASDTDMSTAAGRIQSMNSPFDNGADSQITIMTASASGIDDQNPFTLGIQGTALGVFAGGIQQGGAVGNLGSLASEGLGTIEFALDLNRILAFDNAAGQVAGPLRQGTYEGTFLLGTDGGVSFIPEPSSVALLGLASGALLFRRRRTA